MNAISYALGLHLYQFLENLDVLFDTNHWETTQVIYFVIILVVGFVQKFTDVAHLNIDFSGILHEQIIDTDIKSCFKQNYIKILLIQAQDLLLKAETYCCFFLVDAWISKVYNQTEPARIIFKTDW